MNFGKQLYVVRGNLAERKMRTATAVFVIAFAVGVVMVVVALMLGFLQSATAKAREVFPPGVLVVKPKAVNIAVLAINTGAITDGTVEQIRSMPGVEYAAPQLSLKMPMRVEIEIMGQVISSDAAVVGIDPQLVQADVKKGFTFSNNINTSEPVPSVLPRYLLDIYNLAYSESMGLPKINETFAIGKLATLYLGDSFLTGEQQKRREIPCRIVGLTSDPSLVMGALIPIAWAQEFNNWYHGPRETKYTAVHVKVKDLEHLDQVTSSVQGMNLLVESKRDTLEKIHFATRAVGAVSAAFALIVVAIAAVSIFNTFSIIMGQRRGEVGLLRAVGGTRRIVTWLFVMEVGVIGLLGGILGVGATWALLGWADKAILMRLPKISILPDHVFRVTWPVVVACLVGAVLLSLAASLPMILRTTHRPPANLIAES